MATGTKTGGRDFLPGNKFGKGQVPLSKEVKAIRKVHKETLLILLDKYITLNRDQLDEILDDRKAPALDIIVISAIQAAIEKQDSRSRDFLIERLCGKVDTNINVTPVINHESIVKQITESNEKDS